MAKKKPAKKATKGKARKPRQSTPTARQRAQAAPAGSEQAEGPAKPVDATPEAEEPSGATRVDSWLRGMAEIAGQRLPVADPIQAAADSLTKRIFALAGAPCRRHATALATREGRAVFIECIRATGNVTIAARVIGVDRKAAYKHRAADPDFRDAWKKAQADSVDLMAEEARRRAVDGILKPVFHEGGVCGFIQEYDSKLLMFLMQANSPKYRTKKEVKHKHEAAVVPGGREGMYEALLRRQTGTPTTN